MASKVRDPRTSIIWADLDHPGPTLLSRSRLRRVWRRAEAVETTSLAPDPRPGCTTLLRLVGTMIVSTTI